MTYFWNSDLKYRGYLRFQGSHLGWCLICQVPTAAAHFPSQPLWGWCGVKQSPVRGCLRGLVRKSTFLLKNARFQKKISKGRLVDMIVNQIKNYHRGWWMCEIRSVLRFITEGHFILMPWPWYCEGPWHSFDDRTTEYWEYHRILCGLGLSIVV